MADMKAYWQELAKKYSISSDVATAVETALGNEAVSKAFSEGFVPTPEHHRQFDTTVGPLKERIAQYDKWYKEQAEPVAKQYADGLAKLQRYESLYGQIDPSQPAVAAATGLTEAQLNKILEERFNSFANVNSTVAKTFARASADYMKRFGEVLDIDDFEAKATEAARKGTAPWQAYQEYIAPRQAELDKAAAVKREQEIEERIKRQTEERVRDALSKRGMPVEATKEPSMLYIRDKAAADKAPIEGPAAEENARNEFFAGWNEATATR